MGKEQDLVISLELTCRGSTWIPLKLNSLDIQAPGFPCLQPGDEGRLGEWPHCRREKKRIERQKRKERYIHLNEEFQRIARGDKKTFFRDQCKETEEKINKMGKIRDLFKKIRDTKGKFHAKMDTIKDRSDMDLTEAEDTNRR